MTLRCNVVDAQPSFMKRAPRHCAVLMVTVVWEVGYTDKKQFSKLNIGLWLSLMTGWMFQARRDQIGKETPRSWPLHLRNCGKIRMDTVGMHLRERGPDPRMTRGLPGLLLVWCVPLSDYKNLCFRLFCFCFLSFLSLAYVFHVNKTICVCGGGGGGGGRGGGEKGESTFVYQK